MDTEVNAASMQPSQSNVQEVSTIESHMIPHGANVVFDWDNTLKVINRKEKKIESRVSPSFLRHLKEEKGCQLFIISAIRPSRMNLDTLLVEVDRLGLREFFCPPESQGMLGGKGAGQSQSDFPWMHEGNIIICGYDKAEVFLRVMNSGDQIDGITDVKPVVFFDDEEVNIINFSAIVKGSQCFKIVDN